MPVVRPFEGQPRRLRNTCDPAIYFCDASVVQPAIHTRFFDAVPTQLVGLGILVTFVGLAAGVGLASGSLASAEPAEIQLALSQLLNGASLAFMTSIFGLGSALGFLLVERGILGAVQRQLQLWVDQLQMLFERVTPESIALKQLEQAEVQTKLLERFGRDLGVALERALEEQVTQRLARELQNVCAAVDRLRVEWAEGNQSALQQLVAEFSRQLTSSRLSR